MTSLWCNLIESIDVKSSKKDRQKGVESWKAFSALMSMKEKMKRPLGQKEIWKKLYYFW